MLTVQFLKKKEKKGTLKTAAIIGRVKCPGEGVPLVERMIAFTAEAEGQVDLTRKRNAFGKINQSKINE